MSKDLKKFINEVSPYASVISLALGIYWRYYPQSALSITGGQITDVSSLSTLLIIIGLILLVMRK